MYGIDLTLAQYVDTTYMKTNANAPGATVKKESGVNHPKHYNFGKLEVINVIEDWQLGFHLGNAVKYIARAEHKGHKLTDLQKAAWYLAREIRREVKKCKATA